MAFNPRKQSDIEEFTNLLLTALSPREERILKMRFGIAGVPEHSKEDIARNLHVSKGTVDKIEARALRKLRHPFRLLGSSGRSLADFQRAINTFELIQKESITTEDVASKIKSELPELSAFADYLPKSRVELYAFVQTLLMILTLLVAIMNQNQSSTSHVQQTTNIFVTQSEPKEVVPHKSQATKKSKIKKQRSNKR